MKWIAAMLAVLPLLGAPVVFRVSEGAKTVDVPLERYVAAVLAGESSVFRSDEALKAMAVAARTYGVRLRGRHAAEGYDFCVTTHCQRVELRVITKRMEDAAAATEGELLWSLGKPAFACYTKDCGGKTEDAASVWPELAAPYLTGHDDPYCRRAGTADWQWNARPEQIAAALRQSALRAPRVVERVSIAQRTRTGRAKALVLLGAGEQVRISASSFRFAVGRAIGWNVLPSDRYEVRELLFQGSGAGHGVGLCQRGADQAGVEGHGYREILAFYYPGTLVGITARGLRWQRLGGESMALFTTQPDRDRHVLAEAERLARVLPVPLPPRVELRVYPDVETFRNGTGEPGWVAAHTHGRRVDLQPAGATAAVLRHELLHVAVEAQARPGLPVWFREGLVEYLAGAGKQAVGSSQDDTALRQRDDAGRARRGYAGAARRVTALVKRYGEPAVLGWLKSGLPSELLRP